MNYATINDKQRAELTLSYCLTAAHHTKTTQTNLLNQKSNFSGSSELFSGTGLTKTSIARGKPADEKILELLGARTTGKGRRESELLGPLAWLLAPQGMDSIAPARKEEGIESALGLERSVDEDANRNSTKLSSPT